jgi:hypothetical protein
MVVVNEMPVLASGKVDKKRLRVELQGSIVDNHYQQMS